MSVDGFHALDHGQSPMVFSGLGARLRDMTTGHDPRIVANALIESANRNGLPIWNVSVQKLLYFAHAASLVHDRRPLIRGTFEAWEFGPVCRPIYDALKHHGREKISSLIQKVDPFTGVVLDLPALQDGSALYRVENTMKLLGGASPSQLISLSHVAGGAWSIIWNKSKTGATVGNRIDDELTIATFGKFKVAVAETQQGGMDEATPFAGNRSCKDSASSA